jgi:hypothetical protein
LAYQTIALVNSPTLAGIEIVATKTVDAPEDAASFLVKRKKLPSGAYVTIATVLTPLPANMTFRLLDKNVLSGNSYQYLLVPVVNTVEQIGVSTTVVCNLPLLHIYDTVGALFAYLDISVSEQRNTSVSYVKPLYGKYPHAVRNSDTNYSSGTAEALYLPFNVSCVPDITQATISNFNALEMLTNGLQKVMRTPDGRGWTISVNGEPRVNKDEFFGADTITFDWTEIAAFPETGVTVL